MLKYQLNIVTIFSVIDADAVINTVYITGGYSPCEEHVALKTNRTKIVESFL